MTLRGGTHHPACAACKFRRYKCTPNCPFSPYFPANQPKMFENVHRLFGVSYLSKILCNLKTNDEKDDAMKSIIYEAEMRSRFPIHGCSIIILQLNLKLQLVMQELWSIYTYLSAIKVQSHDCIKVESSDVTDTFTNNQSYDGGKSNFNMDSSFDSILTKIRAEIDTYNIMQQDLYSRFGKPPAYADVFEPSYEDVLKNDPTIQQKQMEQG